MNGKHFRGALGAMVMLLAAIALLAPAPRACAQAGNGFDLFGVPRYLCWTPINLTNHSGTLNASNGPVDLHGFDGIATCYFATTNYAGSGAAIYARLEGSTDGTNWFLMTNTSYATSTTYNVTNRVGGHIETNTFLLPGTITTPTSATAGFASPYLVPQPFTNTAVLCTNVTVATALVGWSVQDGPRYVHVAYTVTGSDVAFTPVALIVARRSSGDFFY